jgi:RNA polymerase sigma-70 factor (ECF subfamily)
MKYISDEDCISRILKKNDNRAFAILVEHHKAMVFTIALRIIGCKEDAEEIAQDVFLKIYNTLHTFKSNSKFSTWLYSIAYNAAISHVRKSKPTFVPFESNACEMADETEDVLLFDNQDAIMQQNRLQESMKQLKEEDILLINMYYTQNMSIEEISGITDLSESNIKVKLFRIRKKLAEKMNNIK